MVVIAAYLAAGIPLVPLIVFLAVPFGLALRSPATGVIGAVVLVPLADGLVAFALLGNPSLHNRVLISWADPVWFGTAAGLVIGMLARRPERLALPAALRLYLVAMLCAMAVAASVAVVDWRWHLPLLARLGWRALPWLEQTTPEYSLRASLLLLGGPLWYYLVARGLRSDGDVRRASVAWLVTSLVVGVYGTWMWLHGEGHIPPRVESVLDDVNTYASYLVVTFFLACAALVTRRARSVTALAVVALLATAWMLFLAGSRIAVVAVIAGALVLSVARWARPHWRGAVVVMVVAGSLVAAFLILPSPPAQILGVAADVTSPGFLLGYFHDFRQAVWSASARAFLAHPVFGLGPGRLLDNLGDYYRPLDPGWRPLQENAHNYFLQLAAETGIVGLLAFCWLVGWVLGPALLARGPDGAASRILAVGALGYLVTCLTGHSLLLSRQVVLFWCFLGLLSASVPPRSSPLMAGPDRLARWGAWGAVALLVVTLAFRHAPRGCRPGGAATGPIAANFVIGFHEAQTLGDGTWRWMKDAGQVRVCNGSAATLSATLTFTTTSFDVGRRLDIHGVGRRVVKIAIPAHPWSFSLPLTLPPGPTDLILVPRHGPRRVDEVIHSGDLRVVSIRFKDPEIALHSR